MSANVISALLVKIKTGMNKKIFRNLLSIVYIFSVFFIFLSVPTNIYSQNSIVRINVSQSSGNVGGTITITGENFPGTSANIYWDDKYIARDIIIAQNGSFTYELSIPAAIKGNHIISADDNSNWAGGKAQTEFNVLPGIDIFPKVAQDQTQILIKGEGYDANEKNIKIIVDGKTIASPQINADSKGHWSANYTVRDIDNGKHTITASSGSTLPSEVGSQSFILAPWLEVKPESGPVGTQLLIYGWGFRLNEDGITVTLDGEIIKVNIRAEVDGSLIVDGSKREYGMFTSGEEYHDTVFIPKTTQGDHIIGVYGSSFTPRGTMPYYTFNVIPNLTVQPSSGNKGAYVTLEGTGFASGETVSLKYDNVEISNTISTDSTGSFKTQYIITEASTADHVFSAQGNKGNTASAPFSINVINVGVPSLESPNNNQTVTLFNSVGDVYLSSIKYLFGLGDFLSGKSNSGNDAVAYFKWNIPNPQINTQYRLQISGDSSFNNPSIEKTLSSNTFALTKDYGLKSGTYYWRVCVLDSNGASGQWSPMYKIEINSMPTRTAIFSIIVFILIIAAIVTVIILLWNNAVNKYKY